MPFRFRIRRVRILHCNIPVPHRPCTVELQLNDSSDGEANQDVVLWRTFRPAMADHRRVLVVDDYRDAAEALQLLLDADGFECRATSDPLDACAIAREWQPFAALLDIAMPGLDGLELARRLRADPITAEIVLIACSGYASSHDRRRAREAGFDAHCAKPLTPELILRVLEFATQGRADHH
ncbi:response regulator [Trinickia symbiotica]|uniref:Response regulator n=1 Tax=Trinickia symbiotica TaxID=863227 RepID=A0A2N7X2G2_9BURK|nr:response regulator [Trinickia symbiotica]